MNKNERLKNKYPDTDTFHFYNANPRGKITTDCSIRAISTVLEQSYEQTLREMVDLSIKTGYFINESKCIAKYMQSKGFTLCKQPRKGDYTKYTGQEFCRTLMHPIYSEELRLTNEDFDRNRILANIGRHHIVAIMSGQIWDTWNSTSSSIGKVWVKKY